MGSNPARGVPLFFAVLAAKNKNSASFKLVMKVEELKGKLEIAQTTSNPTTNIALDTVKIGKQALIFVGTRQSAEKAAEEIAHHLKLNNETQVEHTASAAADAYRPEVDSSTGPSRRKSTWGTKSKGERGKSGHN